MIVSKEVSRLLTMIRHVDCPVCGSDRSKHWRGIRGWNVDRCLECGMKYANPCPSEQALTKAYALPKPEYDQYFASEYLNTKVLLSEQSDWKRHYFQESLRRIQDIGIHKGHILEIGCGAGLFLEEAADCGWRTAGVDIGDWRGSPESDQRLGIKRCTLPEAGFSPKSFDVVYLASVLEHLASPGKMLETTHTLLKTEGVLLISGLPNANSFTVLLGIDRWIGNHPPIHLQYFTAKTINRLLKSTGFSIIDQRSHGISETITEFLFNRKGNLYSGHYTAFIHEATTRGRILSALRWVTNLFLGTTGLGSVLDVAARKMD